MKITETKTLAKAYAKRAIVVSALWVLKFDKSELARKDEREYRELMKKHETTIRAARKK